MDAKRPLLESWAARLGVFVFVALSIVVGYRYWIDRGEDQLAWITVGAELIAFAGLAVAMGTWRTSRAWTFGAIMLTILAAVWCGMTMVEKIRDDGRARAVEAAQATLPYQIASRELNAASDALSTKLSESPPVGVGPQTIAAWEASQAAAVTRLERARDTAQTRMQAAIPPIRTDWFAIVRGVGVELIKLFGFAAFGAWAVPRRAGQPPAVSNVVELRPPVKQRPFLLRVFGRGAAAFGLTFASMTQAPLAAADAAPTPRVMSHRDAAALERDAPRNVTRAAPVDREAARLAARAALQEARLSHRAIAKLTGFSPSTIDRMARDMAPMASAA